ncbi:trypsin-like peptidase domain-containing protein [Akkermansiaceae bacterium]|nr:trypsin-like peptidase domain-containing protein [Akkermansiaceae bacterium]
MKIRDMFSIACLLTPLSIPAADFSKALEVVEASTVLIRTLDSDASKASGTGFFINDSGLLLTNAHVVEGASSAVVQLADGSVTSVKSIKAIFPEQDIAFLNTGMTKTKGLDLIAPRSSVRGLPIGVLGNPKGLEFSFSTGVVAALRKLNSTKVIQFTAPISRGSSGSPIFNDNGDVLGIAVGAVEEGQNLNFGVSSEAVRELLDLTDKQPQRNWIVYDPFRDARGPTQSEMTMQAVTSYEELDKIHQAIYDEILLIYQDDKEFIEYLRKSQRAWIKFKDAHILMKWPALETKSRLLGTAERMSVPIHLAMLTQARIDELLKWRRGLEEGNVDAGTIKVVGEIKAKEKQLNLKAR